MIPMSNISYISSRFVNRRTRNFWRYQDFKRAAKRAQKVVARGGGEYEVSFDNKADFNRFVRNIPILSAILAFKPRSVYELARLTGTDVSNLNKTIQFFEKQVLYA